MDRFKVTFYRCLLDSQNYGSNDEHMVSQVFFVLDVNGKREGDFVADLKQVVGSDFERGAIEVSAPHGYQGPFDHEGFSEAATKYFRSLVGASGSGLRMEGARNIRMRNCEYNMSAEYEF